MPSDLALMSTMQFLGHFYCCRRKANRAPPSFNRWLLHLSSRHPLPRVASSNCRWPSKLQYSSHLLQFGVSCITLPTVTTSPSNQMPTGRYSLNANVGSASFLGQSCLSVIIHHLSFHLPAPFQNDIGSLWFNPSIKGYRATFGEECKWLGSWSSRAVATQSPTIYTLISHSLNNFLFFGRNTYAWGSLKNPYINCRTQMRHLGCTRERVTQNGHHGEECSNKGTVMGCPGWQ